MNMFQVPAVGVDELAARVPDGTSLSVQKGDDVPMALAHALIHRGVRGLRAITLPTAAYPASGMRVDLLIRTVPPSHQARRVPCHDERNHAMAGVVRADRSALPQAANVRTLVALQRMLRA